MLRLTKHCLSRLLLKASASLRNLLILEFVKELEAIAKKIVCKGYGTGYNFTVVSMCSKYFEELVHDTSTLGRSLVVRKIGGIIIGGSLSGGIIILRFVTIQQVMLDDVFYSNHQICPLSCNGMLNVYTETAPAFIYPSPSSRV